MGNIRHIRLAESADLEQVRAIYNREVRESICTFDTQEMDEARAQQWHAKHTDPRYPMFVYDESGEIAGWATLSRWSDRCAYDKAGETSVYVHESHRGKGVARALYDALLAHAREHRFRVLIARVAVPNPASERLHDAVGFRDIGLMREIGEKFGRLIDVRLMDLHIQ